MDTIRCTSVSYSEIPTTSLKVGLENGSVLHSPDEQRYGGVGSSLFVGWCLARLIFPSRNFRGCFPIEVLLNKDVVKICD